MAVDAATLAKGIDQVARRGIALEKLGIAREQLITALDMFLIDASAISVHSLAGNAREILARLCEIHDKGGFIAHAMREWPDLPRQTLLGIINNFRNCFKHLDRDDAHALAQFNDFQNDHMLFMAIYDYRALTGKMTLSMAIFYNWYFVTYPEKLIPERADFGSELKPILQAPRREQKRLLCKLIDYHTVELAGGAIGELTHADVIEALDRSVSGIRVSPQGQANEERS